jgi:hypothetical protein
MQSSIGGIPNYPRGSYSESPMHSRNLHAKLRLSLNHPRWRLGFVRGIEPPFFCSLPSLGPDNLLGFRTRIIRLALG